MKQHKCEYLGSINNRFCACGLPAPSNGAIVADLDLVVDSFYDRDEDGLHLIKAPKNSFFVRSDFGERWIEVTKSTEEEVKKYPELKCYWIDDELYLEA